MTDTDKPAFLQAIGRLAVALRAEAPDTLLMQTYFFTLKDLEIEFVVAAAERLMVTTQWFPKTSEWREAALRLEAERREEQRAFMRKLPSPLCAACSDTGWARDENDRVHRCACTTSRRLELLGRQPWPALPEAPHVEKSEG